MARVTVEDCIDKVESRFELILLSAHRARQIATGAPVTIDRDNDKNPVVSLREIAEETVSVEKQRESYTKSMQKHVEVDEIDDQPDFGDDYLSYMGAPDFSNDSLDDLPEPDPIFAAAARGEGMKFDDVEADD